MESPKFQLFRSDINYHYYFRLRAGNNEIILGSEGYVSKQSCLEAISSVKINAHFDNRYERRSSKNGEYYFVMKAANGEIIGNSEIYSSVQARENGIKAVMNDATNAPVEEI